MDPARDGDKLSWEGSLSSALTASLRRGRGKQLLSFQGPLQPCQLSTLLRFPAEGEGTLSIALAVGPACPEGPDHTPS